MRIFKNRWFARFARKQGISDRTLQQVIAHADQGLIHAALGSEVIKQRIARPNEGKSGGLRAIILFRSGDKAFFIYGFSKNVRGNIRKNELKGFQALAKVMLAYDKAALARALKSGAIVEVQWNE